MHEIIDRSTFDHLVELAALELDEQQSEYLRHELNAQLDSIAVLAAIPIPENTEANLHGVEFPVETSAQPREDEWIPSETADDILKQAPQTEVRFFVVPDIPHTRLDKNEGEEA
jgi:aspartyl/glutamyl-tRNA(Asn/Gln) amidotransferase C subunit